MKAGLTFSPDRLKEFLVPLRMSPLMSMTLASLGVVLLASVAFALSALLGSVGAPPAPANSEWRPPSLEANSDDAAKASSEDTATLSRPIFSKDRKPAPRSASNAPKAEAAGSVEGLSLGAIIKYHDGGRALVVSSATPDGKWLEPGDNIDGWTVQAIEEAELTLQNGQQTVTLRLYPNGSE